LQLPIQGISTFVLSSSYWKVVSLGEKEENPKICSSTDPESTNVVFFPKPVENLKLVEEWSNLSVISDMLIEDLIGEGNPQIYTLCAAGHRSSLRVLKHGLDVTEVAKPDLPRKALSVWTLKEKNSDEFDKYIIISFQKNTLVLLIGEVVVEAKDINLETKKSTLMVCLMEDDSIVQVFPTGIRHMKPGGTNFSEWTCEHGKVTSAACNKKQVALAVQGGELIYFELDSDGSLTEKERNKLDSEILCMSIGDIPKDRQRAKFLACGFTDNTVRLFSLDVGTCLLKLSHQSLPSAPESVCLVEYDDPASKFEDGASNGQLFLHVGLTNGALFKTSVEKMTGSLTETRTRFLGTDPVKLFRVRVGGRNTMLALSSRPWISYLHKDSFMVTPLIYKGLDYVWSFHSSISQESIVGVKDYRLKIFKIENLGELFSQTTMPLRYMPRKILCHQKTRNMFIMEGMHRAYSESENKKQLTKLREAYPNEKNFSDSYKLVAPEGTWASCVRIVSPFSLTTSDLHELKNNETAISMSIVNFERYKDDSDTFLLVGTIKDYVMMPKSFTSCYVHTFLLDENGKKMQAIHTTTMDGIPYSLAPHKGKVLAGIGYMLRMYDLGKKQLLKKCEYKHLYMGVNNIFTFGERIFVTDLSDSFHLLKHKTNENQFVEIADDVLPRWITSAAVLDYHTLVGADKFQNLFVCRLPESVDEEVNEDFFTYKFKWEAGYLNGAACKFEQICNYFYGEVVNSIHKVALTSTSSETIFFATTNGSLGVLFPFETKEEVDFFIHLEMNMRMENQPLSGRDHMAYRSYHGAVKNVVDGDFCEQYITMDTAKQTLLAEEVDRRPVEVIKKLEDIRNRIL
jgi:splicing factor 3B subunit 3